MNKSWIRSRQSRCLAVGALLLAVATVPAGAADSATHDNWQYGAEVYLWGASIGGSSASGSDLDIDFDTLWDDLEMAFMGAFAARKGKWSLLADVIYLDVDASSNNAVTVPSGPGGAIKVSSDVELKGWIVTPAAGYSVVETDKARLDIVAGARYLWLDADVKLDIATASLSTGNRISDSGSVWDAIVGVKGEFNLAPKWYLSYLLDVGTGDTDLTWQALAGVGYRFKKVGAILAYRYMDWDFDDNKVFDDLNLSGPFAGVKFRF